ncbi:globin domain-containing protein [Nocardia brasiliensis]
MPTATGSPSDIAPELEPAHQAVIRATLPLIGSRIDAITPLFYRKMFAAHPELGRDLFNRGNQAQGTQQRALASSIVTFARHLVDPELPHPVDLLSRIGHRHASLGVIADQYDIVHRHLFAAIVEVLGPEVVTEAVAAAWDRVYWLMAAALIGLEAGLYDAAGVAPGDVFRRTVVVDRAEDPSGVVTFVVESAEPGRPLPDFPPGSYISVGADLSDGARQLRQYSLVEAPGTGRYAFTVRVVAAEPDAPAGAVSSWLHDTIGVGDRLEITLPFGDFTLDPAADTPVVLISAGVGITPMAGILAHLAANAPDRPVIVLHADRSAAAHPLRERVRALCDGLRNVSLHTWYQDEGHGRVDLTDIALPDDADYYLCGSHAFLRSVRAQLLAARIPSGRVHFESFAPTDWLLSE